MDPTPNFYMLLLLMLQKLQERIWTWEQRMHQLIKFMLYAWGTRKSLHTGLQLQHYNKLNCRWPVFQQHSRLGVQSGSLMSLPISDISQIAMIQGQVPTLFFQHYFRRNIGSLLLAANSQSFVEDLDESDIEEITIWIMEIDVTGNCNTQIHVVMRSNTAKTYLKKRSKHTHLNIYKQIHLDVQTKVSRIIYRNQQLIPKIK